MTKKKLHMFIYGSVPGAGLLPVGFLLLLLVGGCGRSEAPRLYTLSTLTEATRPAGSASSSVARGPMGLSVRPVALSPYLDRPQMVLRSSPHQVEVAEFDRWAEPLHQHLTSTLIKNLRHLLPAWGVYPSPRQRLTPAVYDVEVQISRFEITGPDSVFLEARWAIYPKDALTPVDTGSVSIARQDDRAGDDYEIRVRLLSDAVVELSTTIAEALQGLPEPSPAAVAPVEPVDPLVPAP